MMNRRGFLTGLLALPAVAALLARFGLRPPSGYPEVFAGAVDKVVGEHYLSAYDAAESGRKKLEFLHVSLAELMDNRYYARRAQGTLSADAVIKPTWFGSC
jgi:hypothetical protein